MSEEEKIDHEFTCRKKWQRAARECKSINDFNALAKEIEEYEHDYGTCVVGVGALAIAGAWLGANGQGITGFQAGCVLWEFICAWQFEDNKIGLRLVNMDDLLFPQDADKFRNTISADQAQRLKEEAAKRLIESPDAAESVRDHWLSLADGVLPFGFSVEVEE